jgi:hypothetical protein
MTVVIGVDRDGGHDGESTNIVRAREQLMRVRGLVGDRVDDSVGAGDPLLVRLPRSRAVKAAK